MRVNASSVGTLNSVPRRARGDHELGRQSVQARTSGGTPDHRQAWPHSPRRAGDSSHAVRLFRRAGRSSRRFVDGEQEDPIRLGRGTLLSVPTDDAFTRMSDEVGDALRANHAVVALESTLITL